MERFSRFRDPGTGIQVFLPPVPPAGSIGIAAQLFTPFAFVVGVARGLLLVVIAALWALLNTLLGSISRGVRSSLIATFGRMLLFCLGFAWISPEVVSLKKRGRASTTGYRLSDIKPEKGSIIISNWSSWIDVLYLSILFNPTFLAPVVAPSPTPSPSAQNSPVRNGHADAGSAKSSPSVARRRNAGAQVVQDANALPASLGPSSRLLGFRKVTMMEMLLSSGETPRVREDKHGRQVFADLETLAKKAKGPVCVFPELVTSNNRGLLRIAPIFPISWRAIFRSTGALRLGPGQPQIYLVSIKHASPAPHSPSSVLSVPYQTLNPLPHVWSLCASLNFSRSLQVRILAPDESPSSEAFTADAAAATVSATDPLSEYCGTIISQLSRLRRTGLGWEDKESFLAMYRDRRKF